MNFLTISLFLTFYVFINPSIDCFFIPNPINWFRKTATELPENMTVPIVSSLDSTIDSTSDPMPTLSHEELFQMAINQSRPIQPSDSLASTQPNSLADRLNKPFTLAMLGMPVKASRFGLEPLPYPMKSSQSKFQTFDYQNLGQNLILNRRIGELLPETTTQTETTETVKEIEFTTTEHINKVEESYETTMTSTQTPTQTSTQTSNPTSTETSTQTPNPTSTSTPTSETTTQSDSTTGSPIEEYKSSTKLPELELKTVATDSEEVSPTPVYRPTSPATDELLIINSSDDMTPKPTLVRNEEFVSNLNNMYYRSDDVFESMMKDLDQFKGRSIQI